MSAHWRVIGLVALAAGVLLVGNVASSARTRALKGSRVAQQDFYPADLYRPLDRIDWDTYYWGHRRYWSDVCEAVRRTIGDEGPGRMERKPGLEACQAVVARETSRLGIAPWEFWRTIPKSALAGLEGRIAAWDPHEDRGRAFLLTLGFRLFGGAAPLLPVWMATLAFVPIFAWIAFEFGRADRSAVAAVFLLLLSTSPFVVDCLLFAHSGIGFYLAALGALVAFSSGLLLGAPLLGRGLLIRALAAGLTLGLCALCRNSVILLVPGFLLALAFFVRRGGRLPLALGASGLLLLPLLPSRSFGGHDVWLSLWEGLGDFDRTKGHIWSDAGAVQSLRASGLDPGPESDAGIISEESRDFLRRSVFRDVGEDPGWYATILGKRLVATVFEIKLWPFHQQYGTTYARRTTANEGSIDGYYRWTRTVDQIGYGPRVIEFPVLLLILPTVLWVVLAFPWRETETFAVLLSVATGAIACPLLFTVGSAYEPQAFALTYFLGAAFLVGEVIRRTTPSRGGSGAISSLKPTEGGSS